MGHINEVKCIDANRGDRDGHQYQLDNGHVLQKQAAQDFAIAGSTTQLHDCADGRTDGQSE